MSAADGITGYRLTVVDDSGTILDSGVGMMADFILSDIMSGTYEITAYGYASDGTDDAAVARSTETMTLEKGGEYSIALDDPVEGVAGEIVINAIPPYSGTFTHKADSLTVEYLEGKHETIVLSTADGTLIYEGDENGVWHYRVAEDMIPSGNAIMMLSVTSDDGNTAERMAMALLFPELRHTADKGDFDFREGKEKVATPIINITKSLKSSTDSIDFVPKAPDVDTLIISINNTDAESSEIFRYHYQSGEFYSGTGIKTRMLYIRADIGSLYGGSSEDQLIEKMRDVVSFGLTPDGPWYSVDSWQSLGLFGCESSYEIPEQFLEATVLYIRIIDLQGRETISNPIAIGETYIEISCTTPDAEIRYTTDGSEPDQFSILYAEPFEATAPAIIKAKAFKEGMDPSDTAEYELSNDVKKYPIQTADPVLNGYSQPEFPDPATGDYGPIPGSGLYREGETVTLTAPDRTTSYDGKPVRFVRWDENRTEVSTDAEYSFICTGPRQLVPVYAYTSGGGGGSSITRYSIIISSNIPAAISFSPEHAERGETVTFYIADGYSIENLQVIDRNSEALEITRNGDGSYTFVMPIGAVTIQAIFTETDISVPLALPDGSVLFYDRGEEYGRYIIGTDGYPVRIDAAVDDGTAESVNWRYLVCEKNDLPEAKEWGPFGVSEGVIDPHIGAGLPNTNRMIEKYEAVDTYFWKDIEEKRKATGFSWFMPSRDELYLIKEYEDDILECGTGPFGSGSTWNWSSTEANHSYVYALVFSINYDETQGKNYPDNCRLIRRI